MVFNYIVVGLPLINDCVKIYSRIPILENHLGKTQTTTINENQSLFSINKNLLINIDWLSIQIDNHSPMRLNFIDFYWLLFIINSWLCNSKNPERHSVLKPWLNLVANTTMLLCLRKFLFPIASRHVCVCCWCVTF